MRCSIKNIKLPPAPSATRPQRVADPKEDAELMKAVRKEMLIRKAREEVMKSENKKKPTLALTLNEKQRKRAIQMWNEGKLCKEIAAEMNVNERTMFGILERMQQRGVIEPRRRFQKVDTEKVLADLKAGKTVTQTAKDHNTHRKTIQRWKAKFKEEGKL